MLIKPIGCLYLIIICFTYLESNAAAQDAVDRVDPFICTDGDNGKTFPGAVTPFGLVKLSPDTDKSYHTASSGYDYSETRIHGFSHIRFGEGCLGSGGNILIKPGIGSFTRDKNKYRETYIKSSEKASPGYYAVDFESGIRAELTVSPRVGFHKYTFPASGEASILIDLSRSYAGMLRASLQIENGNEDQYRVCRPGTGLRLCQIKEYLRKAIFQTLLFHQVR